MAWLNGTDTKIQSFHYINEIGLKTLTFFDGSGDPTATDYIDFLELSGRQQTARTIKFVMGDTAGGGASGTYVVYNVWFADSKAELEDAVENKPPTQIFFNPYTLPQPTIFTFNVSTRYMAINFDPSYGNLSSDSTYLSIYAY
jgi:hypothetical protein